MSIYILYILKEEIKMYFLGLLLFAIVFYVYSRLGFVIIALYDLPSLLFVLLSYVTLIIMTKSFNEFKYGVKVVLDKEELSDEKKLEESIALFKLFAKSSFVISILGIILGVVSIVYNISEPSAIGPAFAVVLLIPLYNVILDLVFTFPIRYKLEKMRRKLK